MQLRQSRTASPVPQQHCPLHPRPPPRRAAPCAAAAAAGPQPLLCSAACRPFRVADRGSHGRRGMHSSTCAAAESGQEATTSAEGEVLSALSCIIDPDFGQDIVTCGFVKDLVIDQAAGSVAFRLQLTTPACPVKEVFRSQAEEYVRAVPWVQHLSLTMDAQAPQPLEPTNERPGGLARVKHVIAVSSCKGGVGKSTTAVNLAYTLHMMGGKVGILDADVHGPSLPTMISPDPRVMIMDPGTRALKPVEYEGIKAVSFGFAGQGSAIMRGAMVSGLIGQLLTTADWGELDYLVVDFPPGTGDIQLTLCQTVAFSAAVVVTTPQKLAYVDVVKGIRMFARLQVPCVAVVENMSYFDGADGRRYRPFGAGSGDRIQQEFGLPHIVRFPIAEDISSAGDGGKPLVIADPSSDTAAAFMDLGAAVVREVAKLEAMPRNVVRFDESVAAFAVSLPAAGASPGDARPLPGAETSSGGAALPTLATQAPLSRQEFYLDPAVVRRNDTSARAIDEWTGERMSPEVSDGIRPQSISPCGNYAVQILWEDGFNQVAPFELLASLERLSQQQLTGRATRGAASNGGPNARPGLDSDELAAGGAQPQRRQEPPQQHPEQPASQAQRILAAAQQR